MRIQFLTLIFAFGFQIIQSQSITEAQALHLSQLPLKCLQQEYPNKLNQVLSNPDDAALPKELHPAFYGCFDWHSAVHGHWSLLYILRLYPTISNRNEIIEKLKAQLTKENIAIEIVYFNKPNEKSFERTYGWSWLLKLQLELDTHPEAFAKQLSFNLKPLTNLLIDRYVEFLPKLNYPIRSGIHQNTAFGLNFAWDYAIQSKNLNLQKSIRDNAIRLYENDQNCPIDWEPSGTDFLSACLEEIGLMMRVLDAQNFEKWLNNFMPQLKNKTFSLEIAKVSDRTDGHLVHLDGLNFSRAWYLFALYQFNTRKFSHLLPIAKAHFSASLPSVVDGNYEGEHWLASFALKAIESSRKIDFK